MKNLRSTEAEINQFNREFEEFENWKNGFEKEFRPRIKRYNVTEEAPSKPWWYANLEKAWIAKKRKKAIKEFYHHERFIEDIGTAKEMLQNPDKWLHYCQERELKRKPGRPKLPPEQRKVPKKKRSDQMRELLESKGVEILPDNSIAGYPGWVFQPNGRVKFLGDEEFNIEPYSISAHEFIESYC